MLSFNPANGFHLIERSFLLSKALLVRSFNPANGFHLIERVGEKLATHIQDGFNPANGFHLIESGTEFGLTIKLVKRFQSRERVSFN